MSGDQVTDIELAILVGGLTVLVVGAWYLQANLKWTRLLAADDPRLAYDPVRDPVGWALGGRYRVSTWLARLRAADERSDVEYWRVRTVNRFVVWIGLSAFAFLAGDELVRYIANFARSSMERYGSGFGIPLIAVVGFMLVFWSAQLGRTLFEYGNGRRPTLTELAVAGVGIIVTLIGMAIMPNLDLSKP